MGDGMLAVFGAPETVADHARRGFGAARAIRSALETVNQARAARREPPLRIGVGLHSGAVVTGCLGSGTRAEFTVIGDTVNTASRLEALTKEKGVDVIVSEETVRRLGAEEGVQALGEVAIRGRKEPLRVYALRT